MDDWKPNEDVLEELLLSLEKAGINPDTVFLLNHGKDKTYLDLVEEMRVGTKFGRAMYNAHLFLRENKPLMHTGEFGAKFEQYLQDNPPPILEEE